MHQVYGIIKFNYNNYYYRYVGSPYQTSLSEAGQVKYLYCMSSKKSENNSFLWKEEDRWPIDIGKKYYKVILFCKF